MQPKEIKNLNYLKTRQQIGYVALNDASYADYKRIGFMSGLEVHQQLNTSEKLFCRCPSCILQASNDYHAEIIRHMRPTLSEMGVYDGTALMEFKTKKEITYRINKSTACTYDIDDTPPFPINREALQKALEISHICNFDIVGEVHITRKQYLDGSIPAGFQRTAILGVNGSIDLGYKKVNLIQLSIEEDSCREISDIGHSRVYQTDRLGVPLIETVTAPELFTPWELKDAAQQIRLINRLSGNSRDGMGAGRQDVNVSCAGGTRIEIKGVSHNKWIPKLSHNEAFRQWALLNIQKVLQSRVDKDDWKMSYREIDISNYSEIENIAKNCGQLFNKVVAINLPHFKHVLSHFTQPYRDFSDEISDRLKVIACIEKPNILSSEDIHNEITPNLFSKIKLDLNANIDDAQIIIWGPEADIATALETVEERCLMAFDEIPHETRKAFANGTTMFERVLPGADRMYPDTDSVPIPLKNEWIDELKENCFFNLGSQLNMLFEWEVPIDTHFYLLRNRLNQTIDNLTKYGYTHRQISCIFGHRIKKLHKVTGFNKEFDFSKTVELFDFASVNNLNIDFIKEVINCAIREYNTDLIYVANSILVKLEHKFSISEIVMHAENVASTINNQIDQNCLTNWLIGQVKPNSLGAISLSKLSELLTSQE